MIHRRQVFWQLPHGKDALRQSLSPRYLQPLGRHYSSPTALSRECGWMAGSVLRRVFLPSYFCCHWEPLWCSDLSPTFRLTRSTQKSISPWNNESPIILYSLPELSLFRLLFCSSQFHSLSL